MPFSEKHKQAAHRRRMGQDGSVADSAIKQCNHRGVVGTTSVRYLCVSYQFARLVYLCQYHHTTIKITTEFRMSVTLPMP